VMQRRSGKSLIEIVVVLSTMTVIMALSITTLFLVMRADSFGMTSLAVTSNRARLSRQFRSDVHAAQSASLVPATDSDSQQLSLLHADATVVMYEAANNSVRRTRQQGDDVLSRETFPLSKGDARFTVDEEAGWLRLVHNPQPNIPAVSSSGGPTLPALHIEARLGSDHRHIVRTDNSPDDTDSNR